MYACGLRISEACSLPVSAVRTEEKVLRVIGKRNTERLVPLVDPVLTMLREVWKTHRNRQWLFPCKNQEKHIPYKSVGTIFRLAREKAGLHEDFTPHGLRHSFATRLFEKGIDIRTIQVLLGHASLRSTEIDLHLTEPKRKEVREMLDEFFRDLF